MDSDVNLRANISHNPAGNRLFRRPARLVLAGMVALALAACASMTGGNKLKDVADELKTALAGEPVQVAMSDGSVTITSSADYIFPSGGWQLAPGAPVLAKMVPTLSKLQHTKIVVGGYTDNVPVGPQLQAMGIPNNLDLSSRRAESVVNYLKSRGVNPNLLSAQGFGDDHPVASNDTPEGRAKNRRVDITLTGDGT
ncbi:OmpA/MotB family protein [Limobrevibacterium gyesilva]|uniref:OmpA family protein n=1 Tax=Limobrevibacterium gyesilva TaxID=2991712 RepID=A0AA41YHI5_9PROT|nr:OmpA family protein [Limobrevibacterium gyesilva]MCW3473436.1 OmpA family protein [Limobrevibacterium gyesilva]